MTTLPAWREIAPDDLSVGCVGFMGGASSLGLGLALARPERRVIVFDGDGSLLMQLGSLATIAGARPRNLVHLLFKNGVYHTSGSQAIPGGLTVDFVTMARGAGYRSALTIGELDDFKRRFPQLLKDEGPIFVELHIRFLKPVFINDTIKATGTVTEIINPKRVRLMVACFAVIFGYYGEGRGEVNGNAVAALAQYVDAGIVELGRRFGNPHPLAMALQRFVADIASL